MTKDSFKKEVELMFSNNFKVKEKVNILFENQGDAK